ncbi:MAG TPA: 2-oxoacid:acceptor oxidoreductase subunit alpha [Acidobacteriota bacterium]|nr:2-oxoacid:acceptor oxidoreductase subunit alpha [Acidobacteriota bacterium]
MSADPEGVIAGEFFLNGDYACAEGAISVGCRFVAGYPITPSTEIVERIAYRFPAIGGMFVQMEDEIASSIAIQGAVWAGAKAMTVTSGPGFSLMMEHIGYAVMTETPCVFINVQRGGPSTGLPTLPAQADMMQARWGSHGDYEIIALCPNSPQECYDLTIKAFNLAEEYRVPVIVMADECVGHMTEKVIIPPAEEIEVTPRRYTERKPEDYLPYRAKPNSAPLMVKAGDGYRFHITGLTHDERGHPAMNAASQEKCVSRLVSKIRKNADRIVLYEETDIDNADVVVVSYGITSRVAVRAIQMAKEEGVNVGHFRLITAWPFPEQRLRELAAKIRAFVMPELNYGQMFFELQRVIEGIAAAYLVGHGGGTVHDPADICRQIMQAARRARERK